MTNIKTELEAAAFRKLQKHLAKRTDVQNIDLMNLAGFCRNCLSRWYQEAALDNKIKMLWYMLWIQINPSWKSVNMKIY